ncbi:MAG: tyrosine-type recombinase/integrase [Desulfobacterales bacterium]
MAILKHCPKCKKAYKLKTPKCQCGNDLNQNGRYRVKVKMPSGEFRSKITLTLNQARAFEGKFKTEAIEQGVHSASKDMIIDLAFKKYMSWAKLNKRSWKNDESRWKTHIERYVSGKFMSKISTQDVTELISDLRQVDSKSIRNKYRPGRLRPATIQLVFALIRHLFNWASAEGLYSGTNPCKGVKMPKFDNRVSAMLSRDEIKRLLATLDADKNDRACLVIKYALYSGKRLGEILKLKWDDVNFEACFVTYRGENTKGGKTQILPLSSMQIEILMLAGHLRISDYVFPSATGAYYKSFGNAWRRIRRAAGISDRFRFHDLRHTFASYLASSGEVDIYTLKELLGHDNISMTQRYAYLVSGALRKAANVAEDVFKS